MPQELHVLRCYACGLFQVHIVKKVNKWECKVCQEKQSVKQVYGRGSGKDCRLHVQKLNTLRGQQDEEAALAAYEQDSQDEPRSPVVHNRDEPCVTQPGGGSKWKQFVDEPQTVEDEDDDELGWGNGCGVFGTRGKKRSWKSGGKRKEPSIGGNGKLDSFLAESQECEDNGGCVENVDGYVQRDLGDATGWGGNRSGPRKRGAGRGKGNTFRSVQEREDECVDPGATCGWGWAESSKTGWNGRENVSGINAAGSGRWGANVHVEQNAERYGNRVATNDGQCYDSTEGFKSSLSGKQNCPRSKEAQGVRSGKWGKFLDKTERKDNSEESDASGTDDGRLDQGSRSGGNGTRNDAVKVEPKVVGYGKWGKFLDKPRDVASESDDEDSCFSIPVMPSANLQENESWSSQGKMESFHTVGRGKWDTFLESQNEATDAYCANSDLSSNLCNKFKRNAQHMNAKSGSFGVWNNFPSVAKGALEAENYSIENNVFVDCSESQKGSMRLNGQNVNGEKSMAFHSQPGSKDGPFCKSSNDDIDLDEILKL